MGGSALLRASSTNEHISRAFKAGKLAFNGNALPWNLAAASRRNGELAALKPFWLPTAIHTISHHGGDFFLLPTLHLQTNILGALYISFYARQSVFSAVEKKDLDQEYHCTCLAFACMARLALLSCTYALVCSIFNSMLLLPWVFILPRIRAYCFITKRDMHTLAEACAHLLCFPDVNLFCPWTYHIFPGVKAPPPDARR